MLDFDEKYKRAENYFKKGDYKNLELYFAKTLPKTLNIKLWELYLSYIRSVNKDALELAYSYAIQNLWFHYDVFPIINDYISLLDDVEKIRQVYNIGLSNPIHNIGLLFKNYEQFETALNKVTAKTIINDKLPIYQASFKLYQRLVPYLSNEFDSVDKILSLEPEERKQKVLEYFIEKYSYREDLYFAYSEFLLEKCEEDFNEDCETIILVKSSLEKGIKMTGSVFLKCYFSFLFKETSHLDLKNESSLICYLNILSQKGESELLSGIEENFKNGETKISALDYAAKLFYSLTLDKKKTWEIFKMGEPLINDKMLDFFLSIYDLETVRTIASECELSHESKQKMASLEFSMGSISNLRKCFSKETFFEEFRKLVSTNEDSFWGEIPELQSESVFRRVGTNECIGFLKNLKLKY